MKQEIIITEKELNDFVSCYYAMKKLNEQGVVDKEVFQGFDRILKRTGKVVEKVWKKIRF